MLSINTNLSSIIAQRSLSRSTLSLNTAIERMTTGFKINHAQDNAANFSISTNMTTKIGAYQVAEDNASMGLDLLTTAEDSLDLISNHLTRLRDLATQASNGTYGKSSLEAINAESKALVSEINRIYNSAEYNGIKLFTSNTNTNNSFFKNHSKVDTSSMTALSSVSDTTNISSGQYSISSAEELKKLADMVNSGKITGGEFVLAGNINLSAYSSGDGWETIGKDYSTSFNGTFDGNGYTISNLKINKPDEEYQGLFGYVDGNVKNVNIQNCDVVGYGYVGAIAGYVGGDVSNCYVSGNVRGSNDINGYGANVGGLAGYCGSVTNCYSTASVSGNSQVGGLAGTSFGALKDCRATGAVVGNAEVGGLAGNAASITTSCATGSVTSNGDYSGGLAGRTTDNITNSYASGSVNGQNHVGGLVGETIANNISGSYAENTVTGISNVGGLAGETVAGGMNPGGTGVSNSFFDGSVSGSGSNVGDFIGKNNGTISTDSKALTPGEARPFEYNYLLPEEMEELVFQIGINSDENSQISLCTAFSMKEVSALSNIGIGNADYFSAIDKLLARVTAKQTEFGATQNRFESALSEISTHYENLASSRSTLRDADIANVSSEYIRQQILQQASATLLSTANQTPSIALQLL